MAAMFACLRRDPGGAGSADALETVARACSPRFCQAGADTVVFDARGLAGVLGPPDVIAREVLRLAETEGLALRVAIAGTMTSAWLLAKASPGVTLGATAPALQSEALAHLPLGLLATLPDFGVHAGDGPPSSRALLIPDVEAHLRTLVRWGLRTLGDVARLPRADIHARLGASGVRLHAAARGEDAAPLVPAEETPRFSERVELEWPIEGLEPLSFVLARLCDALSSSLERADRGAVGLTIRLPLVSRETHTRTLRLPAPMRDARVMRTLILLDLESHPPPAGIDVVEIEAEVAPGHVLQGSLLMRALPSAGELATLIARLGALMGETRVGAPAIVDTHDDRAVTMAPFAPRELPIVPERDLVDPRPPRLACRRFRLPVAVRVTVAHGMPSRLQPAARGLAGGDVVSAAGPWRSSGRWWALDARGWDRDEWDVEVAGGYLYRISRDRVAGGWVIEGAVD